MARASFATQTAALFSKNVTYQLRNVKTNLVLIAFPILFCWLISYMQHKIDDKLGKMMHMMPGMDVCGPPNDPTSLGNGCPVLHPPQWPLLMDVPQPDVRAVKTDSIPFADLPDKSCRDKHSCPATLLLTGANQTLGKGLAGNFFTRGLSMNDLAKSVDRRMMLDSFPDYTLDTSDNVLGSFPSTSQSAETLFDYAFQSQDALYIIKPRCLSKRFSYPIEIFSRPSPQELICVEGLNVWRDSDSVVNDEIYKGYYFGNQEKKINEIMTAFDLLNSTERNFNVHIYYNTTTDESSGLGEAVVNHKRILRVVNMVSNAYLQFLKGAGVDMKADFIKEMPRTAKVTRELLLNVSKMIGALFFTWIILQLFPVVLTNLVYEKQQKLRIMMKMHGLSDGPYWMISYAYFLFVSLVYMICFVLFGSILDLKTFTLNSYAVQLVFYFVYVNLQIAFGFLVSTLFSNVKTATVVGNIYVFASGLLGEFVFKPFSEDPSSSNVLMVILELFPGFSLYYGLYIFVKSVTEPPSQDMLGIRWKDWNDSGNRMKQLLVVMIIEWFFMLLITYYVDQVVSVGSGVKKHPLFFLQSSHTKPSSSSQAARLQRKGSEVSVQIEEPDVRHEREKVEQLMLQSDTSHAIISDNIKKIYPGRDGNPDKFAVRGLSLAIPRGECFGMLGTNGAGKSTFINMMIGLITPSSGTALIGGFDIRTDMDEIYTNMGVCPQHDLLWETLTGREHLIFYGKLKNLSGAALTQAVEESLMSVNLGAVADKHCGKYSGGMKRRLSVAISLIGDPKVVYMDEPSTGLDPASRNYLWNAVKRAKENRAIMLTTHSMEEAEALCDRLGIFVDGSLQCVGNPKELKARYGGCYVFTVTTTSNEEEEVKNMAYRLSPNAKMVYHLAGTQKFELPKEEVRITDVFEAIQDAKTRFPIQAWGLTDTTMEDVFLKVASGAQAFNV